MNGGASMMTPAVSTLSMNDIGVTRSLGGGASFKANSTSSLAQQAPPAPAAASTSAGNSNTARTLMPAFDPRDQGGQRYTVAPELGDSSLRLRMSPALEAAEVALVQRGDEIYGHETDGNWMRVDVPGKGSGWMLVATQDRVLLVPLEDDPFTMLQVHQLQSYPVSQPQQQQQQQQQPPLPATPQQSQYAVLQQPLQPQFAPSQPQSFGGPAATMYAPSGGPSFSVSTFNAPPPQSPLTQSQRFAQRPEVVTIEAYMGLERRVMALENELAQLKHLLRSA